MKNKKLIGIMAVLVFLTVLVILNSTLFTLQSISINWLTTKYNLEDIKDYTMVEDIRKGESIFLVKKQKIANSLEKKYPYLRVVSIETKFPNKLVIHSAERESMFAIKLEDNKYAVVDELGKVLQLSNSSIFAGSDLGAKPIKINLNSVTINQDDYIPGQAIDNETIVNIISQTSRSLRESNYVPTTSKGVFLSLDITNKGDNIELYFRTRNGISIVLKDAMTHMTDKFLLAIERYNHYHQEGVVTGEIEVWENVKDNKIWAKYNEISE